MRKRGKCGRDRQRLAALQWPVSFVAFDLLYDGGSLLSLPLMERKQRLRQTVVESERLSVTRYVESQGISLYRLTEEKGLEGIVAKKKASRYTLGTKTRNWIKCKVLQDAEFFICGYVVGDHMRSLILADRMDGGFHYRGKVSLGLSRSDWAMIEKLPPGEPLFDLGSKKAVWLEPRLQCTVQYMELTDNGHLRQPVFKAMVV